MTARDFIAELAERTILITCPDNDRGGATLPSEGWEERATDAYPTLHEVDGPSISGCYALRWRDDPSTDRELLARSLGIVRSETKR